MSDIISFWVFIQVVLSSNLGGFYFYGQLLMYSEIEKSILQTAVLEMYFK